MTGAYRTSEEPVNEGDVVLTALPVLPPSSTMRLRALTIRFAPDTTMTPRAE